MCAGRVQTRFVGHGKNVERFFKIRLDFGSGDHLFDHVDESFGEVGHGDDGLEFRGDAFGIEPRFPEGLTQGSDGRQSERSKNHARARPASATRWLLAGGAARA